MKILYGVQGTGNGHISRAIEIIPILQKFGEVDVLISGRELNTDLPFYAHYRFQGLGFCFGQNGGIDFYRTFKRNRLKRFLKEVKSLPVQDYDVILSDFEPITAWACKAQNKLCMGLSNQASLLSPNASLAEQRDALGKLIIKRYAPCKINVGFSYQAFDENIKLPIIRKSIRNLKVTTGGHHIVYLPAYSEGAIYNFISSSKELWLVFSKNIGQAYARGNVTFLPFNIAEFEKAFSNCKGIITAAGFGTTTEALFLGKKLLVVPQKNQYEQACNAHLLEKMGVTVIKSLNQNNVQILTDWLNQKRTVHVNYPNQTELIIQEVLADYIHFNDPYIQYLTEEQYLLGR